MATQNGTAERVIFWGLCALVVFLPLPLGSVLEWAVFAFEAAVVALFLVYIWAWYARRLGGGGLISRAAASSPDNNAHPASQVPRAFKALIWVFLGFSALQLVPLPPPLVELLSPRAAALYAGLVRDRVPGWTEGAWHTLSLSPSASLGKLVLMLSVGVFGFLVLRCVRSRREVEIFVLVLIACALFQAFYGMAETFSGHEMIFGVKKRYVGSVSGTFYNRNHLAGFLEMVFPLSLGYLLVKARYFMMEKGMSLRRRILWFSQERLQLTLLFGMGSVFIALGLVFSRSRSGVTIFAATLLLAAFATSRWRDVSVEEAAGVGEGAADGGRLERGVRRAGRAGGRVSKRSRVGRTVRLVAAAVIIAAVWIGLGPVIERFSELDISREGRRVYYRNTLELVRDFPLAGTGKGTFLHAYNMYEKVDDHVRISFAHNDYLEFLAENGVIAGGSLAALGVGFAVLIAVRWSRRRNNFSKGIGLGALLGVTAVLAHGFTDFNLQIPANAACFAALVALGLNAVRRRSGDRKEARPDWADVSERTANGEAENGRAGNGWEVGKDWAAGRAAYGGEAEREGERGGKRAAEGGASTRGSADASDRASAAGLYGTDTDGPTNGPCGSPGSGRAGGGRVAGGSGGAGEPPASGLPAEVRPGVLDDPGRGVGRAVEPAEAFTWPPPLEAKGAAGTGGGSAGSLRAVGGDERGEGRDGGNDGESDGSRDGGEEGGGCGGRSGSSRAGAREALTGRTRMNGPRGPVSLLIAILLTAVCLLLLVPAAGDFLGYTCLARYRETRRSVRSVQSGFPKLEPLLRRAVGWSKRAEFRVELARLYYDMARVENDDGREEERDTYCDLAIAGYENAVRRNPADAFTHYETGLAYLFLNYPVMPYVEKAKVYFRRALALKPADESLNLNVIFLYMTWWGELEQEEKEYAAGLYRRMTGNSPDFAGRLEARWRQSFGSLDERCRRIIDFLNGGQVLINISGRP